MSKTGVVKFFNRSKGFGFLTQDDGGVDLFVHRNDVTGEVLVEGDQVSYSEGYDERGGKPKADDVSGGTGGNDWESGKGGGKGKGGGFGKGGGYGGGGYGGAQGSDSPALAP